MLKPSLQLRIGQKLAMTPQLQQAIRLLQLSSVELDTEIRQALDSNVMLEAAEDRDEGGETADSAAESPEQTSGERAPSAVEARYESPEYYYSGGTGGGWQEEIDEDRRSENAEGASLHDHLHWQLDMAPFSERDRVIGRAVIDGIHADGYLRESIDDLRGALADELEGLEDDEIDMVIHRVQGFDPPGVGARDLRECLCLQLQGLAREGAETGLAERLVRDHLDAIARQPAKQLAGRLGVESESVSAAIRLIRALNPHPGYQVQPETTEYVVPDVVVHRQEGRWVVELNSDITPNVRVNHTYADLIAGRQTGGGDFQAMRGQLQEARWLVRSLEMRNETLMRVATAIVEHQQAFLDHGEEHMKPLVLAEIAETLDLHESTISRVTTRKYMLTPRGVFEFKYFFSTQMAREDGGETSATAVRARIRRMVAEEDPAKPLSDSKLVSELKSAGFRVARRTVAKYREALSIPPSHERRRANA